jgi:hypothetical protein
MVWLKEAVIFGSIGPARQNRPLMPDHAPDAQRRL